MRHTALLSAATVIASAAVACSSSDAPTKGAPEPRERAAPKQQPEERAADPGDLASGELALTEDLAAPHFESGPGADAARAFELEQFEQARDGFNALLASDAGPDGALDRARARLLKGLAQLELEQWEDAARSLTRARDDLPLLEDFIGYHAARAYYGAGALDEAETLASSVDAESIVGADAELLLGDIFRARGDAEAIASHYERYLEARRGGPRRSEARFRLAEARESLGDHDGASRHYRRIRTANPLSEWAEKASERAEELGDEGRGALDSLTAEEYLERGMAYYSAMRNEKAAADLDAALDSGALDVGDQCKAAYHRAYAWYRARDRSRAAPLFDEAREICLETDNEDLQVRAAYLAGRSYSRTGDPEASIARHALVEEHHPDHSFADDARLRQAEQYEVLEDDDAVTELLSTLPELYPDDDMKGEAMWRLAWRAFRAERYEEAIEWLERHIELEPIAQNYWAEGQAQYWKGRAYAELGDEEASIAAYEDAVRTYPLTYYALLALNRLRERHEERYEAILAEVAAETAAEEAAPSGLSFQPRPVFSEPGFERSLELMRLGLGDPAQAELRKLGLTPPAHREAIDDADRAEKLWAIAFLYDRAGAHDTSHWPTRWHIVDYKRHWPVGENRARWRIAYPNAWWDVLDRHASERGFSTELQIALVREESAFDPLIESWANAVGLTQLILPTARRFARGTDIDVSRQTLRDPDTNAFIGARFLEFLHDRYDGHPMLMVPAYNAGEGAVDRWLRSRGHLPADAWVEELRVDQARRYTKRLLGSYFAYAYLNEGRVPELPNELPSR